MNEYRKKFIVPFIVILVIVPYYSIGIYALLQSSIPVIIKTFILLFKILITIELISILIERIKEKH